MTDFDLEKTYLFIDAQGGLVAEEVGPAFWADIGSNLLAGGTMISASEGGGDWPHWEMHPEGAEVLVILEGAPHFWLDHPDGRLERMASQPGTTIVVPPGAWHRAEADAAYKILFITYGPGTAHRPITDQDRARAAAALA